ncbi:MAG: plasmid pRiA4b ORF-3 family protein [Chloroflexi bacterium]|nr:plasmid pRiA4b ORF-3 family protein [Chloroflexota bacterium]
MNIYTLEVFIISGPMDKKFIKKSPVVSRTIEIRGDQTLAQLHKIIFKAFNRFEEHLYEFQIGGKGPNDPGSRRYSFSSTDDEIVGGKLAGDVRETVMDDLKLKTDEAFGYWFDFGDDWWHQINVITIESKPVKGKYPKITNRVGQSPPQYMEMEE